MVWRMMIGALFLCLTAPVLRADSLWQRRDPRFANLHRDLRARRVGDLLTIAVRENTDIDNQDERKMEKATNTRGSFNTAGNSSGNRSGRTFSADIDATMRSSRDFEGKAEFTSERRFLDRMTVVVTDVLPNGNLIIQGCRKRGVQGETRLLIVEGVVRPTDISAANTIDSHFIGNFTIRYDGRGAESSYTSPGFLGKLINIVWPF
jgi:flagellar L-ring protein precursor FlgH